ncbi:uncharacterized protein LOC116766246 [Danaus plexippus]|uniref:uncharacterized protein LOC116766246 n=1 Tax=Danaus plexippus TaxID=13037 RepID=UPI002AB2C19E|nr:uncharacterized protein LOC116766246 [Danaus plexippus]
MEVVPILTVLLIALLPSCKCEPTNGHNYNNGNAASNFGDVLRPPPPPLPPIAPVPFHGGVGRLQRHNNDLGYLNQPPPPSLPPPTIAPAKFNFPAPFYKQYNFNFVPPPQPFTTTPSPTIFQKLSGWLFSSQQVSDSESPINVAPLKKDCNPCNAVPWLPVIRYGLDSEKERQNINPSYGSPHLSTISDLNTVNSVPQPFQSQNLNFNPTGTPHAIYGQPPVSHNKYFKTPSSTYGPPSPTHIVPVINENPLNTPYPIPSSSLYDLPSVSNFPSSSYLPSSTYTLGSTYKPISSSYISTSIVHENKFSTTTHYPIALGYKPEFFNKNVPNQKHINNIRQLDLSLEQQLPKVSNPTGFRNSYGEPIVNSYALDIPVSAAESIKVNTEVHSNDTTKSNISNVSLALANPAPFSLNRGRNIHTLQPVALPNLSVSPLPPIFNARPFRPLPIKYPYNVIQDNLISNNLNIDKSVPIAEYTHLEYPTTIIQSPVIDIDALKKINNSKGYRNIENSYVIDEVRDISPQASEDHTHISKSKQEASFESIGPDLNNDLYDAGIPLEIIQPPDFPYNHKASFADLRGVKDEDVDKYRTESNLQYIDSPLLYLKPSAPHKNYKNFGFTTSTTEKGADYEIYDEHPTTASPELPTVTSSWDEQKHSLDKESSSSIVAQENVGRPKIIQIIVPYTTDKRHDKNENMLPHQQKWVLNTEKEYQARKIHDNTENYFETVATEGYTNLNTVTEESVSTGTEQYNKAKSNDMYDVKEPPFDIIKLQRTIDDWTEQEYSNLYGSSQRSRSNEKYAKQIPDEYFTTINPVTGYVTDMNGDNYDLFDHEGSSSIQHAVTDNKTNIFAINRNDYNTLEKNKNVHHSAKNDEIGLKKGFNIYTVSSNFRSTTSTTTAAPWEKIQTSISPLTNEKVYVVTSKPWRENVTKESNLDKIYDEKHTDDTIDTDDLPFKSPRFFNRPLYGFTSDAIDLEKLDSPYGYSSGWHRRINNLGNEREEGNTSVEDESDLIPITTKDT